ncbi:MAG TPA: hypothetical protein VFR15_16435 [Chloroflexia bacterium]|nr:hypothetical protein [Chloroflexia bacterium]
MANVAAQAIDTVPEKVPYAPGWVDRLIAWVERLALPSWLAYFVPAVALFALINAVKWWDGTNAVGVFVPHFALPPLVTAYGLVLLQYLDHAAVRALDVARPVLNVDEQGYRRLQYELSTMPVRSTLVATGVGVLFAVVVIFLLPNSLKMQTKTFTSVESSTLEVLVFLLLWAVWGPLTYHTVRQLGLVNRIYTECTRIDVFNLDPLYSFSWLTARTAVGLVIVPYMFLVLVPSIMNNAVTLFMFLFNVLLGAAAFAWPLLGAHRLIEEAKKARQREANVRFDALAAELHRRADRGEFDGMAGLNEAMEAVQRERDVLEKIRTWPWRGETVNVLSTALLLPAVLWFITRILERFGL